MANLVNISLQAVSRQGVPQAGLVSIIYDRAYSGQFAAGTPTVVVASGNTGGDGRVTFTGITPGFYDISVVTASGVNYLRNYEVKNEYVVPIGTTSYDFQASSYVLSSGSLPVGSTGILTQNLNMPTGIAVNKYTANESWTLPFPISGATTFSAPATYARGSGNSYYHNIATTVFTQRARIQVV